MDRTIRTDIPQRLDRLPWSRWHRGIVVALGITWLLDGLEVTLGGSLAGILKDPRTLGLSDVQIGASATGYLMGAVLGALLFGWLTDRLGRKRLFFVTLGLYLCATAATALSWNFRSFWLFRALTGCGIGGEYAAVNSAIDELIPAPVRGRIDLAVNATFWLGAALGSLGTFLLLDSGIVSAVRGWRFAFGIGAALGSVIFMLRGSVPESPRWLILRGREKEAERIVAGIEREVERERGPLEKAAGSLTLQAKSHASAADVWKAMAEDHPRRSVLGMTLMVAQSFFYNAVYFTYGLVLIRFFRVDGRHISLHFLILAAGNFLGPLILGRFFDSLGRKIMIAATYGASGLMLFAAAALFQRGLLGAWEHGLLFAAIFFTASSAASSAYLTVSEIFPIEIRAFAISLFYALGTLVGGVGAPALFARLVSSGSRAELSWGYAFAAGLMLLAAGAEILFGIDAERRPLESI